MPDTEHRLKRRIGDTEIRVCRSAHDTNKEDVREREENPEERETVRNDDVEGAVVVNVFVLMFGFVAGQVLLMSMKRSDLHNLLNLFKLMTSSSFVVV